MNMINWWNDSNLSTQRNNLSNCHFVHQKYQIDFPGIKLRPPWWQWLIAWTMAKLLMILVQAWKINSNNNWNNDASVHYEDVIRWKLPNEEASHNFYTLAGYIYTYVANFCTQHHRVSGTWKHLLKCSKTYLVYDA